MEVLRKILQEKLLINSAWLIADALFLSFFGFLFWTLSARIFPPDQVGLAATLLTATELLVNFSLLGFDMSMIKFLPKSSDVKNIINSCFTLSSIVMLILCVIFVLFVGFITPELSFLHQFNYGILFVVLGYTALPYRLTGSVFIAFQKSHFVFIRDIVYNILKISLPFLLFSLGAIGIFSSAMIAAAISVLVIMFFFPNFPKPSLQFSYLQQMFRFSASNYVAYLFNLLPQLLLPLIITSILTVEETAYFYIAWMISTLFFFVPVALSYSFLAESSTTGVIHTNVKKVLLFSFLILFATVPVALFISKPLLTFFGQQYADHSLMLLRLLLISSFPFTFNTIYIAVNNALHQMQQVVVMHCLIAVSTILFSTLFLHSGLTVIGVVWLITNCILSIYSVKRLISYVS